MFPRLGGGHRGAEQPGTYLCPALKSHLRGRVFKSKNGSLKKKKNQAKGERGAKENSLPHKGLQSKDKRKSTANTLQAQRTQTYPVKEELSCLHFLSAAAFLLPH